MKKNKITSSAKYKATMMAGLGLISLGAVWACYQVKNTKLSAWPLFVVGTGNLAYAAGKTKLNEHIERLDEEIKKKYYALLEYKNEKRL